MSRPSWDRYYMKIAREVATRSTCTRRQVGAVIVLNNTIVSTGYNGSIRGAPHCTEMGCMMEHGHCIRTVHAEVNAILQAAKNGVKIDGATMYTTTAPCWNCSKVIANSGIMIVVYADPYVTQLIDPSYPVLIRWLDEKPENDGSSKDPL